MTRIHNFSAFNVVPHILAHVGFVFLCFQSGGGGAPRVGSNWPSLDFYNCYCFREVCVGERNCGAGEQHQAPVYQDGLRVQLLQHDPGGKPVTNAEVIFSFPSSH